MTCLQLVNYSLNCCETAKSAMQTGYKVKVEILLVLAVMHI